MAAATSPPARARAVWAAWAARCPLEEVRAGQFRILPTLAHRLEALGVADEAAGRLRGVYRYAWTQSQITLRSLEAAIRPLEAAGIATVSHRGVPIAARYLGDPAGIVVDQVDLLVKEADLDHALARLREAGWQNGGRVPPRRVRAAFRSVSLASPAHRRLVLHWRVLPVGCPRGLEDAVVERAAPSQVGTVVVRLPERTDQLLLELVRSDDLTEADWPTWALLVRHIADAPASAGALSTRAAAAGVPGHVLERLERLQMRMLALPEHSVLPGPGAWETHEQVNGARGPAWAWRALSRTWRTYRAVSHANGTPASILRFPGFLLEFYRQDWAVVTAADLGREALTRLHRGMRANDPSTGERST